MGSGIGVLRAGGGCQALNREVMTVNFKAGNPCDPSLQAGPQDLRRHDCMLGAAKRAGEQPLLLGCARVAGNGALVALGAFGKVGGALSEQRHGHFSKQRHWYPHADIVPHNAPVLNIPVVR